MILVFIISVLLIPLIMILFGVKYKKLLVDKPDLSAGYASPNSSKSKLTWTLANTWLSRIWTAGGAVAAVISVVLLIIFRKAEMDFLGWLLVGITGGQLAVLLLPMAVIEIILRVKYDKKGRIKRRF